MREGLLDPLDALLKRKEVVFRAVRSYGDFDLIEEGDGPFNNIYMPQGDGVERSWEECNSRHGTKLANLFCLGSGDGFFGQLGQDLT